MKEQFFFVEQSTVLSSDVLSTCEVLLVLAQILAFLVFFLCKDLQQICHKISHCQCCMIDVGCVCTAELRKEGNIKIRLYCMAKVVGLSESIFYSHILKVGKSCSIVRRPFTQNISYVKWCLLPSAIDVIYLILTMFVTVAAIEQYLYNFPQLSDLCFEMI